MMNSVSVEGSEKQQNNNNNNNRKRNHAGDDDDDVERGIAAAAAQQQQSESFVEKDNTTTITTDPFLASMTFTSFASRKHEMFGSSSCDCDECGRSLNGRGNNNNNNNGWDIPNSIAAALEKYKKQRRRSRIQDRTFLKRSGPISVWEYTLPQQAEPLVEFGSSNRIVYVKRLSSSSQLLRIGSGIIGSRDEEKQRTPLPWKQGEVWVVPSSSSNKAIGWIHVNSNSNNNNNNNNNNKKDDQTKASSTTTDSSTTTPSSLYATLIVARIPPNNQKDVTTNPTATRTPDDSEDYGIAAGAPLSWMECLQTICQRTLLEQATTTKTTKKNHEEEDKEPITTSGGFRLNDADAQRVREALK